jgi:glycosyltransferase involved in cell wall biosynthesis
MTENLITVLICTRNRAAILERVLATHLELVVPEGWNREYVIVDNGSTDHTREVVGRFQDSTSIEVQYVHESRAGHSIALNTGCLRARGSIIAFTDDDAIPSVVWLEEIVNSIAELGNDWVYGPVFPSWEYGKQPGWYGSKTSPWVACIHYGDEPFHATESSTTFVGVNHACRKDRIAELGYYDLKKGLQGNGQSHAGNDDDLYAKALGMNWKVFYNPKVAVNHIIDRKRYTILLHLKNAWLVGRNECLIRSRDINLKTGTTQRLIPNYRYALFGNHVSRLLVSIIRFSAADAWYYFSQMIRFFGLFFTASKIKLGLVK